jgi:hypothetical protein
LGEKPREIKGALGTHAPQQTTCTGFNDLLNHLVGMRE